MLVIVDSGICNTGSILNMCKRLGVPAKASASAHDIQQATHLVLPGVGAFDSGMRNLRELGLLEVLHEKVMVSRVPTLGICLGMQLMTRGSEEGGEAGLGWIDAVVTRFRPAEGQALKIPHMGWNTVQFQRESPLQKDLGEGSRFYFVHSYHVVARPEDVLAVARHGETFTAALQKANLYAVQFHPEKSHRFGLTLLRNFATLASPARSFTPDAGVVQPSTAQHEA